MRVVSLVSRWLFPLAGVMTLMAFIFGSHEFSPAQAGVIYACLVVVLVAVPCAVLHATGRIKHTSRWQGILFVSAMLASAVLSGILSGLFVLLAWIASLTALVLALANFFPDLAYEDLV